MIHTVHTVHTINLDQYALFDDTKNPKHLKRWFNLLPTRFFNKQVEALLKEIGVIINNNDVDDMLDEEVYKQICYVKIQELKNLYKGVYNILVIKTQNDLLKKQIGIPVNDYKTNLGHYLKKVEKLSNIRIDGVDDLIRLAKHIKHKEDKFKEVFNDNNKSSDDKVAFIKLAVGTFNIMDKNYNGKWTMYSFAELKAQSLERTRKYQTHGEEQ